MVNFHMSTMIILSVQYACLDLVTTAFTFKGRNSNITQ